MISEEQKLRMKSSFEEKNLIVEVISCDFVNLCLCKIHCRLSLFNIFGAKFPKTRTAW